jgi:PAS domain S-box-containing protein
MLMLPDFRVRQRDFLLEILRAITAQLDIGEVLRRTLNASIVMMAGQNGLIALRGNDGYFHVRAVNGIDNSHIQRLNAQLRELVHRMSDQAQTLEDHELEATDEKPETDQRQKLLNDVLNEMAATLDPSLRQSIALPLIFAGDAVGILIVFRSYRTAVSPNDIQILQSFADQAAIAVHNAHLYEEVDHERMWLAAILDHSADGVMILSANLSILHFNPALERLTGLQAEEALRQHHDEVLQWSRLNSTSLSEALANGWPFNSDDPTQNTLYVEGDLQTSAGLKHSVAITYAPMLSANNRIANIVANVRDITNFRQAQEMQNVFIGSVSHELKTPVAIIKGYAATLRREDANWTPEIVRNTMAVIEEEADRLNDLIQNLLTASKLQVQQELSLELSEVNIAQLAQQVAERFTNQTTQHSIQVHFPSDFPYIDGDITRLRQVLDNLVSNAIKYSPNGGVIKIVGQCSERDVTVSVSDQGEGISVQDLNHIFERFFRVDNKLSRRTQGTGLGLYLVKAIIEAHHGKIDVKSKYGKGSTFYFTLPRTQPSLPKR